MSQGATPVPTQYECDECEFVGTIDDLTHIDDVEERVLPGEFMAAGCCPECGSMLSIEDADVPSHTIDSAIEIARARGVIPDLSDVRNQFADLLARLEYLKPERFDNDEHEINWHKDMANARALLATIK